MDRRRRAGAIAASGAAISGSAGSLAATHHGSSAGLPGSFWIGFGIGLALVLLAAAVVLTIRRANDQRSNGSCG
jgi:hypothetical protein